MGSMSDRIGGIANETVGRAKQSLGKSVGNERLQADGATQTLKGKGQQALGGVRSVVERAADRLRDAGHRKP